MVQIPVRHKPLVVQNEPNIREYLCVFLNTPYVIIEGKDTRIDLKKYSSVRSRKLADARVDDLSDGKRKHRKSERSEDDVTSGKEKYSGHLSSSQGTVLCFEHSMMRISLICNPNFF